MPRIHIIPWISNIPSAPPPAPSPPPASVWQFTPKWGTVLHLYSRSVGPWLPCSGKLSSGWQRTAVAPGPASAVGCHASCLKCNGPVWAPDSEPCQCPSCLCRRSCERRSWTCSALFPPHPVHFAFIAVTACLLLRGPSVRSLISVNLDSWVRLQGQEEPLSCSVLGA